MTCRVSLRELEYLLALEEEHHFGRAAARCFVSQPTLSGQLKKLEKGLGLQLVERNNRRVRITAAGEAVVAHARRIFIELRELESSAEGFRDPLAGELQLGLIPTVAPYLLPRIMPLLSERFPELKIWLHEQQTHVLMERLERGELDLLILALPLPEHDFVEVDLFREPFLLALPADDPQANEKEVGLEVLNGRELMLLEEGHCLREHALDVCVTAGAGEYAAFHATSLETLRHMVGEGMGATLMPQLAVPRESSRHDSVRYIPFREPAPSRRIGLLHRKGGYRAELFEALAETITRQLPFA